MSKERLQDQRNMDPGKASEDQDGYAAAFGAESFKALLAQVESGEKLNGRQKVFHSRTKLRDIALLSILFETGISAAECVGLNVDDVDFSRNCLNLLRITGLESFLYFGDETAQRLRDYIKQRSELLLGDQDPEALFISLQRRRISVRAVEILVKKHAGMFTGRTDITPQRLAKARKSSFPPENDAICCIAQLSSRE